MKKIYFDMDGTVYNLYDIKNWLDSLENEEDGIFLKGQPLIDMNSLKDICIKLINQGWQIGVITWLPMYASDEAIKKYAIEKKVWVEKFMPYVSEFFALEYGVPKQYAPTKRSNLMILIDDNKEVREMWKTEKQRKTIDASLDIIEELEKLL